MSLIELKNVYKIFGTKGAPDALILARAGAGKDEVKKSTGCVLALRDVSLAIAAGEIFVVMGVSGSGKTTLLRHMNRLVEPTSGQTLVKGRDILRFSARRLRSFRRKTAAMVFQRFTLFPHMTVLENADGLVARRRVSSHARRAARARRSLEEVGLKGAENAYPSDLSGGERQRVAFARALCADTEILLMDEPFSALDPLTRRRMQDILIERQAERRKTIVFVTNDLGEAFRLGGRIAILKGGVVHQVGAPEEILLSPATGYVREFAADVNRGRVITAGAIMTEPVYGRTGPEVDRSAVLQDLVPLALETDLPLKVVDPEGGVVGAVSRETLLRGLHDQYHPGAEDGAGVLALSAGYGESGVLLPASRDQDAPAYEPAGPERVEFAPIEVEGGDETEQPPPLEAGAEDGREEPEPISDVADGAISAASRRAAAALPAGSSRGARGLLPPPAGDDREEPELISGGRD